MKTMTLKLLTFALSGLFLTCAHGLVDYSNFTGSNNRPAPAPQAAPAPAPPAPAPAAIVRREAPNATANSGPTGAHFNVGLGYEMLSFEANEVKDDISFTRVHAHFQTNFDLFLRASYWRAETESSFLTDSPDAQEGNPEVIVGFNWLKFGAPHELAAVDLYGGAVFGGSSDLAQSRTDKIAGIETSKRFGDFLIGLGFEYRFTGEAKRETETSLGPIQKLAATLGWRATPDIQFLIEGASVQIKPTDNVEAPLALTEGLSYSTVTPKLGLGIRQNFQLELGARFHTKRVEDRDALVRSRLWDIGGGHGTSLFASLNIVI